MIKPGFSIKLVRFGFFLLSLLFTLTLSAQPLYEYRTLLEIGELEDVSPVDNIDEVVIEWHTTEYPGDVAADDLEYLRIWFYSGVSLLGQDTVIVDGVIQPIDGVTRTAADVSFDFHRSDNLLWQIRNALDATMEQVYDLHYQIQDNLAFPIDNEVWIASFEFGEPLDFAISEVVSQQTTLLRISNQPQPDVTVSLSSSLLTVDEQVGDVQVTASLSSETDTWVKVDYDLVSGTAVAGEDFVAASGTITIEPGETTQQIVVSIIDDDLREPPPDETFTVVLSNPAAAILGNKTRTIAIVDNEYMEPTVFANFTAAWLNQTVDEDVGTLLLEVELTGTAAETVILRYTVTGRGATAGQDFPDCQCQYLTATIPVNQTSVTIPLDIIDDTDDEFLESILVTLTEVESPFEVGVGENNESNILIIDNDEPVVAGASTVSFEPIPLEVTEGTAALFIRAVREGDLTMAASVDFRVDPGTAAPGLDYVLAQGAVGTLQFAPGNQVTSLFVQVVDDAFAEPDEHFTVTLLNPQGTEIGQGTKQIAIFDDDNDNLYPPALRTLRTDGANPDATVYGGVSTDLGNFYTEQVSVGESIGIYVTLEPRLADLGRNAQVVVVVRSVGNHVQITPDGILPLDVTTIGETVLQLVPFAEVALTERVDLNLLQFLGGSLSLTADDLGLYEIFVGYTTDDLATGIWAFTYNDEPIRLEIR